jgi:SET domain-containing protein
MGLFAAGPISQGTPFWRFTSGFDQAFSQAAAGTFPETARHHLRWFGWVSRDDGSVILSGDHACFMNHSSVPNTGLPQNAMPPFTTVALRDIAAGEELTCDYHAFDADAPWKLAGAAAVQGQAGR